jgi:hypothetical protein
MALNGILTQYDDAGFPVQPYFTGVVAAASGLAVLKAKPGRLVMATVTVATTTNPVTFYDNALGTATGTVLLVIPAAAAAGTVYAVSLPCLNGLTVNGAQVAGSVTVGWS